MLSLLTYGATFGVAERASTRHELEAIQKKAIDSRRNHSRQPQSNYLSEHQLEHQTKHQTKHQTEQEQRPTKGGVSGWLRRLLQRQT